MTPDEALYRELFMAELWPTCREEPREMREERRKTQRDMQREIEDREAATSPSTLCPQVFPELSTGCAENGGRAPSEGGAKCA